MPPLAKPTDAELDILNVLWTDGPSTVRHVHEQINRVKPTQYTTILKQMQIMTAKGLVERDERERAHVYKPTKPRDWTQRQIAGDLVRRAFGGSPRSLLMGALSARRVSAGELAEIRKLLDDYEKEQK